MISWAEDTHAPGNREGLAMENEKRNKLIGNGGQERTRKPLMARKKDYSKREITSQPKPSNQKIIAL